jgi:phosphoglycerate-specific signal transduction histidine kinase
MTQTNQQIAEELLRVISNSQHHNTALALKETLEKLRELISGTNENVNWRDECNVSYVNGYDDCLHEIDKIVEELGVL